MAKSNINDFLSEYEQLLGENIDNIQAALPQDLESDNDFIKLQQQVQQVSNISKPVKEFVIPEMKVYEQKPSSQRQQVQQTSQVKPQSQKQPQQIITNQQQVQQGKRNNIIEKPKQNARDTEIKQSHFDSLNRQEKFNELCKKHRQSFNFVQYLITHFKQERATEINQLISALENSKKLREEFLQGGNPPVGMFLVNHLPDISFEQFHGYSQIEYQARHSMLIEQVTKAIQDEEEYLKYTSSQTNQKQQNQRNQSNISQSASLNIQQYEQLLRYLNKTEFKFWSPLPKVIVKDESRQFFQDNRQVPVNTLRIKFKRILGAKDSKYYVNFSLEVGGQIKNFHSDNCGQGCVFNYERDIEIGDKKVQSGLIQKIIEIKLMEKGIFSDSQRGSGLIKLDKLKNSTDLNEILPLNQSGLQLEYSIQLREPLGGTKKIIQQITVLKLYPDFDLNDGVDSYVNEMVQKLKTTEQNIQQNILVQSTVSKQMEVEAPIPQTTQTDQNIMLIHMEGDEEYEKVRQRLNQPLPQNITQHDLEFPEDPLKVFMNRIKQISYSFFERYEPFLKEQLTILVQDISMRVQKRYIQKLWESYLAQKTKLSIKLENGEFEWYLTEAQGTCERDKELFKLYQEVGAKKWAQFVKTRQNMLEIEIAELKEQMQA